MRQTLAAPSLIMLFALAGCTAPSISGYQDASVRTQYDYVILRHDGRQYERVRDIAPKLASSDVVVVGEYHGHHGSHLLQSSLQRMLFLQNPKQVLSMEQFELDKQPEVDRYLAGESGETELIEDADAWSNYRASYRPLVEFARLNDLPIIAANAPGDIVRCVGRNGIDYLDSLPEATRSELPETPLTDTPAYREKFVAIMSQGHGGAEHSESAHTFSDRMENTYQAQLLRDNTMAQQIIKAKDRYPDHQVLHITGTFHSENRLGTVAVLEKQRPALDVVVVSPVIVDPETTDLSQPIPSLGDKHQNKGDYVYLILPLPEKFKDPERQRAAMMAQFKGTAQTSCD